MFQLIMWMLFSLILGLVTAASSRAETEEEPKKSVQRIVVGGEGLFMLPELGAAIVGESGKVVVRVMPPADRLPKGVQKADLKPGDEILMLNGKRVKTAAELKEMYEALKVGEEIGLGVKRGEAMHIVSIKKADPETLPKQQMMIKTVGGDSHGKDVVTKTIKIPSGDNVKVLTDAGLIIGEKDGGVVILGTLPEADELYSVEKVKDGDIIVSVQDKPVVSVKDLTATYKGIKVGDKVIITLSRDGKTIKTSFDKPVETDETSIQK